MNIGDRVRLLHGNEEGRIVAFKDNNIVEVEIDDGFIIPALKNELVIISQEEGDYFGTKPNATTYTKLKTPSKEAGEKAAGLYLGFMPVNEQDVAIYLINTTHFKIVYSISEYYETNSKGIDAGAINQESSNFITYFKLENFDKWPAISVQLILYNHKIDTHKPPLEKLMKFKASSFFKSKSILPLMEKEGYLISIPLEPKELKAEEIKNKLVDHQNQVQSAPVKKDLKTGGSGEIDLHVDALFSDTSHLNKEDILDQQLEAFEKALNEAMVTGKDQLKVIHGRGNGILRHEIHKRLSQLKNIKYFEDADRGKFGYGATLVHLL